MKRFVALLAILVAAATPSFAHEYTVKDILVFHPTATASVPGIDMSAGYFTITNNRKEDDKLVSVEAPTLAKAAALHTMEMDGKIAKMREVEGGVVIAAGQKVEFTPIAYHVMFKGLLQPLTEGQKYPGKLHFEKSGDVDVVFNIEAPGMAAEHNHAAMDGKTPPPPAPILPGVTPILEAPKNIEPMKPIAPVPPPVDPATKSGKPPIEPIKVDEELLKRAKEQAAGTTTTTTTTTSTTTAAPAPATPAPAPAASQ